MSRGLLKAGSITFGGVVVGAIATFVLTSVVTNLRGASSAGLYFQAIALFAIATSALQLGADTALVRTLSAQVALGRLGALRATVVQAVLPVLAVGLTAGLAVWLGADALGALLVPEQSGRMASVLRAAAPFLPAGSLFLVLLGGTRGLGGVLPYTLTLNVALPLTRLAAVTGAILLGFGIEALIGIWASPLLVLVTIAALILIRQLRSTAPDPAPFDDADRADPRRFWSFALPRGASTLVERCLDWGGVLIVLALAGPVQGAIYAVVNRCANVGLMIDQAARVVTGPRISRALAAGDKAAAETLLLTVTRALVLVGWPFYLTLAVFAPAVLALFGPEFPAGADALRVAALSLTAVPTAAVIQTIILMGGRSSWQLLNRIAQLVTLVVVTLALVPLLGITGAALGWTASIAVDTALAITQVRVRMGMGRSLRRLVLPAVLAVSVVGGGELLATVLFGTTLTTLLLAVPVVGIVYATAIWAFRSRLDLADRPLFTLAPQRPFPRRPDPSAASAAHGLASTSQETR